MWIRFLALLIFEKTARFDNRFIFNDIIFRFKPPSPLPPTPTQKISSWTSQNISVGIEKIFLIQKNWVILLNKIVFLPGFPWCWLCSAWNQPPCWNTSGHGKLYITCILHFKLKFETYLKGVDLISSDFQFKKEWHSWFTTLPSKPLSKQNYDVIMIFLCLNKIMMSSWFSFLKIDNFR